MDKKMYDLQTIVKVDFREVREAIYSSFELLADDIAAALITLEQEYENKKMLFSDQFSDELALELDNILNKKLRIICRS